MKLLPVVLIPNLNQNILKKPFYKYTLNDAYKFNNEIFVITNKKNLDSYYNKKKAKIFYLKRLIKKNIEKILKKNQNYDNDKYSGFIIFDAKFPWRNFEVIKKGIQYYNTSQYDLVKTFSIAEENPFKMWYFKNQRLTTVTSLKNQSESHSYPRQLLPITYIENGFFEIIRKNFFKKKY